MSAMVISGGAAVPRGQISGHANKMCTDELYIHLYSHKLQLQKQEIKETKKKETHNVSKNTKCQMHTNYAQRKRKIIYNYSAHYK